MRPNQSGVDIDQRGFKLIYSPLALVSSRAVARDTNGFIENFETTEQSSRFVL